MFSNQASLPDMTHVEPITDATMARIIGDIRSDIKVPYGVTVLWDPKASIDLAMAPGLHSCAISLQVCMPAISASGIRTVVKSSGTSMPSTPNTSSCCSISSLKRQSTWGTVISPISPVRPYSTITRTCYASQGLPPARKLRRIYCARRNWPCRIPRYSPIPAFAPKTFISNWKSPMASSLARLSNAMAISGMKVDIQRVR